MSELRDSIGRAQAALWRRQREDGAFRNENYAGPSFTGMLLAAEGYLGVLKKEEAAEAVRFLAAEQRDDGSFPAYPLAENGDLSSTLAIYAGLHAARTTGVDVEAVRQKAQDFIERSGGSRRPTRLPRPSWPWSGWSRRSGCPPCPRSSPWSRRCRRPPGCSRGA